MNGIRPFEVRPRAVVLPVWYVWDGMHNTAELLLNFLNQRAVQKMMSSRPLKRNGC